jgi:RimJ/RimL family protein N-acetyltransferase
MKELVKKLLRLVVGDYAVYHIYAEDPEGAAPPARRNDEFTLRALSPEDLAGSADPEIREQAGYLGEGAYGFGCFENGQIVGVCFYWHGARYLKRNFWPLGPREAKLVQIFTLPKMRGRSVAPALIAHSASAMRNEGFERSYARIWHSNLPSVRAFERAGWKKINTVVQLKPFFLPRAWKFRLKP